MYADQTQSVSMTEQSKLNPELEMIHERLSKCNSENISLLQQVEDRLHKILNKRNPENESNQTSPTMNDFVSAVHQQLNYYESHNAYLTRILNHLSQIC